MSKKHFIAMAAFIAKEKDVKSKAKMADLVISTNDNSNFDRCRFLTACGLSEDDYYNHRND